MQAEFCSQSQFIDYKPFLYFGVIILNSNPVLHGTATHPSFTSPTNVKSTLQNPSSKSLKKILSSSTNSSSSSRHLSVLLQVQSSWGNTTLATML